MGAYVHYSNPAFNQIKTRRKLVEATRASEEVWAVVAASTNTRMWISAFTPVTWQPCSALSHSCTRSVFRTGYHYRGNMSYKLQWGSEIRTSLDCKRSKEVGWQMVQISDGIWNPKSRPFEILTNGLSFCPKPFEIQTKYGFWMVGTIALKIGPFEIWSSKSSDFECFQTDFRSLLYSSSSVLKW